MLHVLVALSVLAADPRPCTSLPWVEVQRAIRPQRFRMLSCLEAAVAALPATEFPSALGWRFDIRLRIAPSGKVERASVTGTGKRRSQKLETCLRDAVLAIRLPMRSCTGAVDIVYPYRIEWAAQ
jgi:hypothetical protein